MTKTVILKSFENCPSQWDSNKSSESIFPVDFPVITVFTRQFTCVDTTSVSKIPVRSPWTCILSFSCDPHWDVFLHRTCVLSTTETFILTSPFVILPSSPSVNLTVNVQRIKKIRVTGFRVVKRYISLWSTRIRKSSKANMLWPKMQFLPQFSQDQYGYYPILTVDHKDFKYQEWPRFPKSLWSFSHVVLT